MSVLPVRPRQPARSLAMLLAVLLAASLSLPAWSLAGATARDGYGVLRATTQPAVDAMITVDGISRNTGEINDLELPVGDHEVCFGHVDGHLAPPCEVVAISEGAATSVVGAFATAGRLEVGIDPPELEPIVSVTGIERDRGATTVAVAQGSHEVCFGDVAGYEPVACQQVSVTQGSTETVLATYVELASEVPVDGSARVVADLVALYDFEGGSGSTVADVAGVHEGLDLRLADTSRVTWTDGGLRFDRPTLAATAAAPAALYDAVSTSDEFTVEAWITPSNTTQNGPARIVSLGRDTARTNLLVGQGEYKGSGDLIETRLHERSGDYKLQSAEGSVSDELTHLVITRTADATVSVYLDGELSTERKMAADITEWDASYLLGIGSELTGQRPWLGTYHLVALYATALDHDEVTTNHQAGPDGVTPVEEPPAEEPPGEEPPAKEASHGVALRRSDAGLGSGWSGASQGRITTSRDGQIIEGRDLSASGGVVIAVKHQNVTIRNNRISHRDGANGIVVDSRARGTVIRANDFDGHDRTQSGNSGSIGIVGYGQMDVNRNHFQGGRDAIHIYGTDSMVTENWVTDLHRNSGAHNDSIYMGGRSSYANVVIARNRVIAGNSGGIDLYALYGSHQGVDILDNLIIGEGTGFGLYGGRSFTYYGQNRDIRVEGNRFTGTFGYPMVRGQGSNAGVDLARSGNTFRNNRFVGTTTDLPARCGVTQDACHS